MSAPTQDTRPVRLATVLGKDELLFQSLSASERLAQPFEIRLQALSTNAEIDFKALIGTPMSVCLDLPEGRQRFFNGWVSDFAQVPYDSQRYVAYQIVLRPWLWFLSQFADCRFFQDKTIPEVLELVFKDRGLEDYKTDKLNLGEYPKREYCAQYRETDFNFIQRRLEEEGMYYYFEHTEDGKHILMLVDEPGDHETTPGYESLPFVQAFQADMPSHEALFDWSVSHRAQPTGYALNSFYFETPSNPLYKLVKPEARYPELKGVIYDYPSPNSYRDVNTGERYAKIRLEELHAQQEQIQARTNAMGLAVGKTFTLSEHPRADQNRAYLITASQIELSLDEYESAAQSGGGELRFHCALSLLDAKQPFRPLRRTPVPVVQGPQTAIVVPEQGQESEEISTDPHGRIKVRFHWNRPQENMGGENQQERSCWVRVSHPWAGKSWGAIAIPRIGQEVIIDFEEGNCDQPICTGRVYNGEQKPPFELPGGKNTSGLKTDSTKGGGGYNEIALDDTKNKELIRIHAQYDMDTTVEHDQRNTIINDRTTSIQEGNDTLTVVAGKRSVTVHGDSTHTVEAGARTVTVTGGDYSATSTDAAANITGHTSVSILGETAGVNIEGKGGPGVMITGNGEVGVGIDGTPNIQGTATTNISLTAPQVFIGDKQVTIKGSLIVLDGGGGKIMIDSSGVTITGPKIISQATGTNNVIGAMVMIN